MKKSDSRPTSSLLLGLGLALGFPTLANALPYGVNLITNPGAEIGTVAHNNTDFFTPSGWSTFGSKMTGLSYSAGGGFPTLASPGPADRGNNFFAGGPANGGSAIFQTISIADHAADIDAGLVEYDLSGYFGGFDSQNDRANLSIRFLDALNNNLYTDQVGPVSATDRGNITGMLLRESTGEVPIGARQIFIQLQSIRSAGAYNDGYADNLHMSISLPDSSSTMMLMGASLGAIGLLGRRRLN